jgi:chromosome segregation ATPase
MIQLPYKLIAGGAILLAILIGWFTTAQRLKVANANLAAAAEREARWQETTLACQANRAAIEKRFDAVVAKINEIAAQKERLQGALDSAGVSAREIAKARDALERLQAEHEDLVNRAVPLDACQTYELVLAAFGGGSHVQ